MVTSIVNTKESNVQHDDPSYSIAIHSPSATTTSTTTTTSATVTIPALAFGLYKVPDSDEGVEIVTNAILQAGYRHLDSASIYGNEKSVGKALALAMARDGNSNSNSNGKRARVSRSELFVASKVWNDAQRKGRAAVRASVLSSLSDLGLEYLDLCYVHWPVPGCFVETYRELMALRAEGKIRHLGISNFSIADYEELVEGIGIGILPAPCRFVAPIVHQFEVSPFLYRPEIVSYFRDTRGMLVAASKALHRACKLEGIPQQIAVSKSGSNAKANAEANANANPESSVPTTTTITPAQVLLRWSLQKGFVVLAKTSSLSRMRENRDVLRFHLTDDEMEALDAITTPEAITARDALEAQRKTS